MAEEKKIKRSVSFSPSLLAAAQAKSDKKFGGNLSLYLTTLAEADLEIDRSPAQGEGAGHEMAQLAELCRESGIDPVLLFRSVMLKVLQYAKENGDRLILPIRIESPNSEIKRGSEVWTHLGQESRDQLLIHANRGDSWPAVVQEATGSLNASELHDLRLAYIFLTSVRSPESKTDDRIAAESATGSPSPKRVSTKGVRLAKPDQSQTG